MGGCLGPCALSNVALLLYGGEQIWFHSIETDEHVIAIFDYLESMVRESSFLPPPDSLRDRVFDVFDWDQNSPTRAPIESIAG
jgi:cobaltochelatase CobN